MVRCALICLFAALAAPLAARAAEVADATGRTVTVPDRIAQVLPAGPPAAVLLAAIAPGLSMGFTGPVGPAARAALSPEVADRPTLPRLTGGQPIESLRPDLILDYGTVSPRYIDLAQDTQRQTGIPVLLFDGALERIPAVARTLGTVLHQRDRAEAVALAAEALLALPKGPPRRVYYARGADGALAAAPGTDITAVFARLGWQVLAPEGTGTLRRATPAEIAALDPDVIVLADPAARAVLASPEWAGLRAVREGQAYIAPSVPFGWIEEPPSVNRLAGLAWLRGGDPAAVAALFNAAVYGRALTADQVLAVTVDTKPIRP